MTDLPYHKSLRLENFTAFADAFFEFVPGINVFVGENGTGKTHAMKALYAAQLRASRSKREIPATLQELFQIQDPGELIRLEAARKRVRASGDFGGQGWYYYVVSGEVQIINETPMAGKIERPVFIPAIDMMGHTKSFLAAASEVVLDFDLTCTDIVGLMGLQRRNGVQHTDVSEPLAALLGGTIEYDEFDSRFYLAAPIGRMPMPMVAEGLRKIATLVRLLQKGWLGAGATLFWDEPGVNMNPKLMDELIGALLALARSGVQVFLATHSYVILKELDLQAKQTGSVRYFRLQKNDDGTTVNFTDDLALLQPNPILEQYDSLYDRELTRSTGRNRHGEPVR